MYLETNYRPDHGQYVSSKEGRFRDSVAKAMASMPSTAEVAHLRNKAALDNAPIDDAVTRMLNPSAYLNYSKHKTSTVHSVNTDFTPERGSEKFNTIIVSENIHELKSTVQNFAENQSTKKQSYCPVGMNLPIVHTLTGDLYTAGDGLPGRMVDTSAILATTTREICSKYRELIKSAITINSAAVLPSEDTDGAGRDASGLFSPGGGGEPAKTTLKDAFDEETGGSGGGGDGDGVGSTSKKDGDKSRLRSAAKQMRSATANTTSQAALDAADVNAASATTKSGQADAVAGDLNSALSRGDVKVVEILNIYKYITPEGLSSDELKGGLENIDDFSFILVATNIGDTAGFFDEEFNIGELSKLLSTPQEIYNKVVVVLCDYMGKLNDENIYLTENCMRNSPEWHNLVSSYKEILKCDVWLAVGGGRQLQAHFSMSKRIINYLLGSNQTPQIKKYLRGQNNLSFATGSAAGEAFGVLEYMGGGRLARRRTHQRKTKRRRPPGVRE